MSKFFTTLAALLLAALAMPGVAHAQTATGTLVANPSTVDGPGEHTFVVEVAGFTPGLGLFVLPCAAPAEGDMANFQSSTCDLASLTPATVGDDGTATAEVTYEVPEGGMVIAASDIAQSERAAAFIEIEPGAADTEDKADADATADADGEPEALAETGVETGLLAVVAAAMVVGGCMVLRETRRF